MNFLYLLALWPFLMVCGDSVGNFTIITPNVIRRGKPFNVVVRGFGLTGTVKFILRISGVTDSKDILTMKRLTRISDQKPRTMVQIDTSKIPPGTYNFSVSTTNYSDSKSLTYKSNEYAFLIQTDKAIYFPGDLIRFRVLAMNSETKSINPKRLPFILVRDAKGSVVLNISETGFVKGKYQSELQLTDTPSFGFWHIEALSGNDTGGRFIEVADVVLPAVHAELTIPSKVPFSDGLIPIVITTKESFNGNVSGIATITITKSGAQVFIKELDINVTRKVLDVNFELDLKVSGNNIDSYDVELEYFDIPTNSTVTDLASFDVLQKPYTAIIKGDPFIKPGSEFTFSVVVVKYDGSPGAAGKSITIDVENADGSGDAELDEHGSVTLTVNVESDASFVLVKASSSDVVEAVLNVSLPLTSTGYDHGKRKASMRLDVVTKTPAVNEEVTMEVTLSDQIETVYCIISAKGLLLETIEVPISVDSNKAFQTATFTFNPTFAYAPIANIIGYYVKADGRIVTASTSVELTRDLRNYLSFLIDDDTMEIGTLERTEFQVESYLSSTVSMFAYNQRLLSFRDSVSITKDEVFSSLLSFYASTSSASTEKLPDYEFLLNYYGLSIFTNIKPQHSSYHYRKRSLLSDLNKSSRLNQTTTVQLGASRQIKTLEPFASSFLWKNIDIREPSGDDGKGTGTAVDIAGNIQTSFVVYGVAMNAFKGFGLPSTHPIVNVFMPFFITADFPVSVKVSQVLVQGITLFNYLADSQSFELTINKDPSYVAVQLSSEWRDNGDHYTRTVVTEHGIPRRILFPIKPIKIGYISFQISATSPVAGDSIERILRVIPYGVYKTYTDTIKAKFTGTELRIAEKLTCKFPETFIASHSANVTISGNIMSRILANLPTGLINMPYGCGEQTLIFMVPDIVAWIYLNDTKQMTSNYQHLLEGFILSGYQRELTYQRTDGGFAAFGNWDSHSSTWLTTYAGWAFYLAKDIISIDMNVLRQGLNYLSSTQRGDGSFFELQPVYHVDMDGGVDFDITLTAYISIYLTTVIKDFPDYKSMQERAITYLEMNWHSRTDVFGLAIITYALKLAGSPKADNIMNFFFSTRTEPAGSNEIYYDTVETTAYCLLLLLVRGERLDDAEKITNYLVRVSNQFGGYSNTQNTVMGVYALFKYSLFDRTNKFYKAVNTSITSNNGDNIQETYELYNVTDIYNVKLSQNASSVNITAISKRPGDFVVSLTCAYYEQSLSYDPPIDIVFGSTNICPDYFIIRISISYNVAGKSTGMSTATVTMPSGFTFKEVPRRNATEISDVKPLANNKVELYFGSLTNTPINFRIKALKSAIVNGTLEGYVQVIDNYNPANEASATFALPQDNVKSCDLATRRR